MELVVAQAVVREALQRRRLHGATEGATVYGENGWVLVTNNSWKAHDGAGKVIKEAVADQIIEYMARAMPNLPERIIGRQMLSPLDLETIYGLTESDIFHGRHDMDQVFSMRPHPRAAQYETPVKGLYLCGSCCHPGGNITGLPGYNCAQVLLKDLGMTAPWMP